MGEAGMKKSVIVALAVVCAAVLFEQSLIADVGVKAGVSFSRYQWMTPVPIDFTWGYLPFVAGGIYFEVDLGVISIQPGVFMTRMGGRYSLEGDSLEFRFDYVQVPLLLKMNVLPSSRVCPYFSFGGYGAYLYKAQGILVLGLDRTVEDLIEEYKRLDAGLVFSGGFDFKLTRATISVECRYAHGLMNAQKYPVEGEFMKHRSIMALVGIGF
jgi:hypothetical protein